MVEIVRSESPEITNRVSIKTTSPKGELLNHYEIVVTIEKLQTNLEFQNTVTSMFFKH